MGMFSNFEGLNAGDEGLNVEGESLEDRRKRREHENLRELTKDAYKADQMDLPGPEGEAIAALHKAVLESMADCLLMGEGSRHIGAEPRLLRRPGP